MTDITPKWLDKELWDDYVAFRAEIKKPLTEVGKKRAIIKLQRFHDSGKDVNEIIEQSITNNWLGLFAVKQLEQKQSGGMPNNREIEQMAQRANVTAKAGEDYPSLYRRVLEANRR